MAFQRIKNFFHRHKNKFIITGVIVTGSIFLAKYGHRRIKEWQERETKEFLERVRKQQHFESTERTCNQTIQNLSITLLESIQKILNTDKCIMKLQCKTDDRMKVWESFKIMIFTRLCTLVYANAMLTIMLRMQLNLIGGYLYKDAQSIDSTIQQKYLSMCESFLEKGIQELALLIHTKTSEVLGPIDLKKRLSLYDIEQIFWAIQAKLSDSNTDPIKKMKGYIIIEENGNQNDTYKKMVQETSDLFDSEEVCSLVTNCVNRGFSTVIDKMTDFYTPGVNTDSIEFIHPSSIQIHLVKLIPILNTFLTNQSLTQTLVRNYIVDDKLKMLGANVYEAFSST